MSNRLISLLIILAFILASIGFYYYFYIYSIGSLNIKSNVANYEISLKPKNSYFLPVKETCIENECIIKNLPYSKYNLLIEKDGYKDYSLDIEIFKNKVTNKEIFLEKIIDLKQIENPFIFSTLELTNEEKINYIKHKKFSYAFFDLENLGYFYFLDNKETNKIDLYFGIEYIGSFKKELKDFINIFRIYGNNDYVAIKLKNKLYFYDLQRKLIKNINIPSEILYVKNFYSGASFLIITDVGAYTYDFLDNTLNYFSFFSDFVYIDGNYIGIIDLDDNIRKSNLDLNLTSNLLFLYNPETKVKKKIKEISFDIKKIFYLDGKLILSDEKYTKFYNLDIDFLNKN